MRALLYCLERHSKEKQRLQTINTWPTHARINFIVIIIIRSGLILFADLVWIEPGLFISEDSGRVGSELHSFRAGHFLFENNSDFYICLTESLRNLFSFNKLKEKCFFKNLLYFFMSSLIIVIPSNVFFFQFKMY